MLRKNTTGSIKNPVARKKNGDKQRISKELQLFLGGLFVSRRIDRQSGEKRPNDAWRVNGLRQYGSHAHNSEHNHKIRVLASFQLFQQVFTQAAQADQDEWKKDGDLDDLNQGANLFAGTLAPSYSSES